MASNYYALIAAGATALVLLLYLVVFYSQESKTSSEMTGPKVFLRPREKILKIFMMTKNEWPIIEDWVLFHGDTYGFNNLYVYDASDDPVVVNFLNKSRTLGVHVTFTQAKLEDLEKLYNIDMKKEVQHCDLMIKMDSDELLYMYDPLNDTVIVDQAPIQHYLNSISIDGRKYAVDFGIFSYINASHCQEDTNVMATSVEFYQRGTKKTIVPSLSYEHIDLGGHFGKVKKPYNDTSLIPTNFGIAHFHNQCFGRFIKLNNQAVMAHGYLKGNETQEEKISRLTELSEGFPLVCKHPSCHKIYQMLQYLKDPIAAQKKYQDDLDSQIHTSPTSVRPQLKNKLILLEEKYKTYFV